MMRLLMSIEMVTDVRLKRVGWFRWQVEQDKQTKYLRQCSDCGDIVSLLSTEGYPPYECKCAPCRLCGEAATHKNHASQATTSAGFIYPNQWQWSVLVTPPKGKHYYSPERRKVKR